MVFVDLLALETDLLQDTRVFSCVNTYIYREQRVKAMHREITFDTAVHHELFCSDRRHAVGQHVR
jgi:hypothetical protein